MANQTSEPRRFRTWEAREDDWFLVEDVPSPGALVSVEREVDGVWKPLDLVTFYTMRGMFSERGLTLHWGMGDVV